MISCFCLKGPCSSVRGKNICQRGQILIIVLLVLSMKNILINIKTKKCTPKSVLRWEFASVYLEKEGGGPHFISKSVN